MGLSSILLYLTLFVTLFFEVFLLITYFEIRGEMDIEIKSGNKKLKRLPSVAIIVPCYNEERTVAKTVDSILDLNYPQDLLRILVVDDGSKDKTLEMVRNRFGQHKNIEIFSKENGGKHTALNFALTKIDAEFVGCLDADSFVDKEALRRILPYFDDKNVMAVTPSIRIHDPKTVLQYMQKIEYTWGIFLRRLLSSMDALYVTPGPFSIFRTKIFRELGGYKHAHHAEDMEMALRMQKNGYKIVNAYSAHVFTVGPEKVGALYKQRVRWVYGFLNNVSDYKEIFFNKKYGNLGMFILPIATFSIFSTIYAAFNLIWNIINKIPEQLDKYEAVGMSLGVPNIANVNWFAFDLNATFWIMMTTVSLSLVILYFSLKVAHGKVQFSRGILYYLTIYLLIVPFWLTKAAYSTIARKSISWK